MGWLDGIKLNGHEFEQTQGDGQGQGSLLGCSPWGQKESESTERLNNNRTRRTYSPRWMFCSRRFCFCSFPSVNTHTGSQSNLEKGEDLSILRFWFSFYLRKKVRQRKIWPEKSKALMLPRHSSSISASPFPERILTPGRQARPWQRAASFFRFWINSSLSRDYYTGKSVFPWGPRADPVLTSSHLPAAD